MSQRSMVPVLIMGALVLVGGVVLYVLLGADDEPARVTSAPSGSAEVAPPAAQPGGAPAVTPTLPGEQRRGEPGEPVKEYVVGDRRVRDHRTGDRAPIDIPPAVHPPDGRKITSNLTHEIGQKVKVFVKECAQALPATARGGDPRLEGKLVIAIKNKQVTVTEAIVQLRDVEDASTATIKQCIEDKARTVTHVAEEQDLESYDINLSYSL